MSSKVEKAPYVALATPFRPDGKVNFSTVEKLVNYYVNIGIKGLLVGGTTGLGELLSLQELKELTEVVTSLSRGRLTVMVVASRGSMEETREAILHLNNTGCHSIVLKTPQSYAIDEKHLIMYFKSFLSSFPDIAFTLYYVGDYYPSLAATVELTRECKNVVAVKHSGNDFSAVSEMAAAGLEVPVFVGYEVFALPCILLGASGMVSGIGAALPELIISAFRATQVGNRRLVSEYHRLILYVCSVLYREAVYGNIYRLLELRGFEMGTPRLPVPKRTGDDSELLELLDELSKRLTRLSGIQHNQY